MAIQLTPELAAELKKNLSDRKWRIRNLYHVKNEKGLKVKFVPRPVQQYLRDNLHYFSLILKSRQHGITTDRCIDYLDRCLFVPNLSAAIVAQSEADAMKFFADKVKFAYDNIDPDIKEYLPLTTNNKSEMVFDNGSSIYCDASLRGGTVNLLHISEFGPMCANAPERAREVISGALNTVHPGNLITIESTGAGEDGKFYEMCQQALKDALAHKELNKLEFKFFFFGWYCDAKNVLPAGSAVITKEYQEYFDTIQPEIKRLSELGIIMPMPNNELSAEQKAWYVTKSIQQGDEMHSEHPSIPEESFRSNAEGRYYRKQFQFLHENKRICRVPHVPGVQVNTSWDLGADDYTAIWFHQKIGPEHRLIGYYENYGEDLSHYVRHLQDRKYVWGRHYLPHDAGAKRLSMDNASIEEQLHTLGLRNTLVVTRTGNVSASIEETRQFLMTCWIDEEHCDIGIKRLQAYRKQQDKNGRWKNQPLHSEDSDGADSFRTLACGIAVGSSSCNVGDFLKTRGRPDSLAFR